MSVFLVIYYNNAKSCIPMTNHIFIILLEFNNWFCHSTCYYPDLREEGGINEDATMYRYKVSIRTSIFYDSGNKSE